MGASRLRGAALVENATGDGDLCHAGAFLFVVIMRGKRSRDAESG